MIDLFRGKITIKDWAVLGVVTAFMVGLAVLFYLFVAVSQNIKISELKTEINDLENKIKEARNTEKNYDQLQLQAKKMDDLVRMFNERLPEKREVPKLMKQFEQMGDSLGLKTQLTPLPTIIDASKEVIPYQVKARGSFHQIVAFINLLEKDQRYLKISELDIGPEKAGVCEATFVLSTFRFVEQEEETQPTGQTRL